MLYIPAPGSPGPAEAKKEESSDSEEDTLDAFMSNLVTRFSESGPIVLLKIVWNLKTNSQTYLKFLFQLRSFF